MGRINTPLCRIAFPFIFAPRVETGKELDPTTGQPSVKKKYGCALVFDESAEKGLAAMKQEALQVGVEAFGENFWALVQQGSIRWPFRNGADINPKTGQPRFGEGITYINASSGSAPDVVSKWCDPKDPKQRPLKVTDPSELWPGEYIKANVTFKEYKRADAWGIACYVNGIQLHHEGERWGGGFDAQDAFEAEGQRPTAEMDTGQVPPAGTPNFTAPGAQGGADDLL